MTRSLALQLPPISRSLRILLHLSRFQSPRGHMARQTEPLWLKKPAFGWQHHPLENGIGSWGLAGLQTARTRSRLWHRRGQGAGLRGLSVLSPELPSPPAVLSVCHTQPPLRLASGFAPESLPLQPQAGDGLPPCTLSGDPTLRNVCRPHGVCDLLLSPLSLAGPQRPDPSIR